jgi:prephenate dehydratase
VTTVAYAGGMAAHSAAAAERLFAESGELIAVDTFLEVVQAVESAAVSHGVLPIESSLAGSVAETHDLLYHSPVSIVAETSVPIRHHLAARTALALEEVKVVRSHPVAFEQCRRLLASMPGASAVAASTTAEAAAHVADSNGAGEAAIVGDRAVRLHGLHVVVADVGDHPEAYTRFVAVAMHTRIDGGTHEGWRTSFSFVTDHRPAALVRAIEPFAAHGIDLLQLVSRPIPESPFTYRFDAVLRGHPLDEDTRKALTEVRFRTRELRILGSYPAGA